MGSGGCQLIKDFGKKKRKKPSIFGRVLNCNFLSGLAQELADFKIICRNQFSGCDWHKIITWNLATRDAARIFALL